MVGAEQLLGLSSGSTQGGIGQRGRVGAHVGDVAAFIEPLGNPHGALGAPPEFARGLLLQRGSGERRRGCALGGFLHNAGHAQGLSGERICEGAGRCCIKHDDVGGGQLAVIAEVATRGHAGAVHTDQSGIERPRRHLGTQIPVRRGAEGDSLTLTMYQQPHGHRLHATG